MSRKNRRGDPPQLRAWKRQVVQLMKLHEKSTIADAKTCAASKNCPHGRETVYYI